MNLRTFLVKDFHMKVEFKYIIECFYLSIAEYAPLPISYRKIMLTNRIIDMISAQLDGQQRERRYFLPEYGSATTTLPGR